MGDDGWEAGWPMCARCAGGTCLAVVVETTATVLVMVMVMVLVKVMTVYSKCCVGEGISR